MCTLKLLVDLDVESECPSVVRACLVIRVKERVRGRLSDGLDGDHFLNFSDKGLSGVSNIGPCSVVSSIP